jgi:hypothetical protein
VHSRIKIVIEARLGHRHGTALNLMTWQVAVLQTTSIKPSRVPALYLSSGGFLPKKKIAAGTLLGLPHRRIF